MHKEDLKRAIRSMGLGIAFFLGMFAKIMLTLVIAFTLFITCVYIIAHYFLFVLTGIFIVGMIVWFNIEMINARQIREHEEQIREYKESRRNHG